MSALKKSCHLFLIWLVLAIFAGLAIGGIHVMFGDSFWDGASVGFFGFLGARLLIAVFGWLNKSNFN
jgi:hypothetical protein